ncbi:hypothetical protein QFZ42_002691 [Variovorax paradoxus]|uniref:hypothetical protein n=1 Tax=Variovorax paradoxus TaxID=34073 RepID=UPI0027920EE6|nr:hypothetical protein [Variovorax paradoxus]MDQ0570857.1 hypothetical protein [Variovorax paradoxus]
MSPGIDVLPPDAADLGGRRMRNYQLDVADVHADGGGTGAFLGAVLAKLDEPFAREVLQLRLAQLRVQRNEGEGLGAPRRAQHFPHVGDMQIDQVAEGGRVLDL